MQLRRAVSTQRFDLQECNTKVLLTLPTILKSKLRPSDCVTLTLRAYNTHSFCQFATYYRAAQLTLFTKAEFLSGQTRLSVTNQIFAHYQIFRLGEREDERLAISFYKIED